MERCLDLVEADGRRCLTAEERESTRNFWMREFSTLSPQPLEEAVLTFLREKPRGRPSIGELWAILRRGQQQVTKSDAARTTELRWASEILESPESFRTPLYEHTIRSAERILKRWGVASWQDAMAETHPGWTPPTTREAYL